MNVVLDMLLKASQREGERKKVGIDLQKISSVTEGHYCFQLHSTAVPNADQSYRSIVEAAIHGKQGDSEKLELKAHAPTLLQMHGISVVEFRPLIAQ